MPCSLYTEIFWSCGRAHQIQRIAIASHDFYTLIPEQDPTVSQTVFICIFSYVKPGFPFVFSGDHQPMGRTGGLPSPERAVTQTQPKSALQQLQQHI